MRLERGLGVGLKVDLGVFVVVIFRSYPSATYLIYILIVDSHVDNDNIPNPSP
jgi:hypothetical protein